MWLTACVGIVCVHEWQSFITAGALFSVTLIHRVHHHRHLLTCAAQSLLTLLGQFSKKKKHKTCSGWQANTLSVCSVQTEVSIKRSSAFTKMCIWHKTEENTPSLLRWRTLLNLTLVWQQCKILLMEMFTFYNDSYIKNTHYCVRSNLQ